MEILSQYKKFLFRIDNRNLSRLIENVETTLNMALLQSQRILEDNASVELPRVSPGPDEAIILKLFADIHFYLVSVDNVRKSIERLDKAIGGKLSSIRNDYREFFNSANTVRRCQEHLDQRIESGEYSGVVLYDNWVYEICGASVVVGPIAARKLTELYRSLEEILESVFPRKTIVE